MNNTSSIRILLLEDDIETVSVLSKELSKIEQQLQTKGIDLSLVVLSEYTMVEEYLNSSDRHEYHIVLLDRDCNAGGSFHVLDIKRFNKDHIVSISSTPQWNEEAQERGIQRVVWKDYDHLEEFAQDVGIEVKAILRNQNIEVETDDSVLMAQAIKLVQKRNVTATVLTKNLGISYSQACRLMDLMREADIIDPAPEQVYENSRDDEPVEDLYDDAVKVVKKFKKATSALLQRELRIGYPKAAYLIDMMEEQGLIGAQEGNKPRKVFYKIQEEQIFMPPDDIYPPKESS